MQASTRYPWHMGLRWQTILLKLGFLFSAVAAAGFEAAPANSFTLTERTSDYEISFSDPSFSDAVVDYQASASVRTSASLPFEVQVDVKSNADRYRFTVLDDTEILENSATPFSYRYVLSDRDGASRYQWGYRTPVSTTPAQSFAESWIVRSFHNDHWNLEFWGGGSSVGMTDNAFFALNVSIRGNWSTLGNEAGQVAFIGMNPGYTIADFLTYNPQTDRTTFRATQVNWDTTSPNLYFVLRGETSAAVPEPTLVSGCLATVVGGGALRWRSRKRKG